MSDIDNLSRVDEMCKETLPPELYEQWETIHGNLLNTRHSLKHLFSPSEESDRFCKTCGEYLTNAVHRED